MKLHKYFLQFFILIFSFFIFNLTLFSQRINIDNGWEFALGNASNPTKDFNYSIAAQFLKAHSERKTPMDDDFNDSTWRKIDLPHDWVVELPFVNSTDDAVAQHGYKPIGGLYPETNIGWYRKKFTVLPADSGKRFQLQFDGIFRDANIWVNGFYLGNNKSGYIGTSYDITDFINYEKENTVVVRVDASQFEGWFYEGAGIYRHVWLRICNNINIIPDGLFVYTKSVANNKATIHIETEIENKNFSNKNISVQSFLLSRTGKKIASSTIQNLSINSYKTNIAKQEINITQPHLWSLEDPYLYRVAVVVKQNDKTLDTLTYRFGIRTIEIKPNGVFLNGKHVKLKGTNNHQDHAGVGSAIPDYLQYHRIKLLKDMGSNTYRASHNPPTPELLDACDSLGMLVLDETRLMNSGEEYINQFKKLLNRDRSRTSVFLWSIGNEEQGIQTITWGKRIAEAMLQVQKNLDPSRTAIYAADLGNVFQGINEVIPVRGFNYREKFVADYHNEHPQQPIIGTEMGSTVTTRGIYEKDTINCYVPDKDLTHPWWSSTAEEWWKLAADKDFWLGGYIWTGFDYRGEPTPYLWPNINSHFGVMDVCGFPKNIYYYYKSWWSNQDVIHVLPHWNWQGQEGKPIDVWVFSNADEVELFLNEKSLGKKTMPRNGHLQWDVNYMPGTLKAVGYKNGKTFIAKQETTNKPAGVNIVAAKTTMLADGKDATVINVSVIDDKEREVSTADNLIKFKIIKGDAKIIGVGNGDPSSHEPDKCRDGEWQRHLFNGKCQLILQTGTRPGTIVVEASSEGLWKNSVEIFSIPEQTPKQIAKVVNVKRNDKEVGKILGADISFLPELEDKGIKFSDNKGERDAIAILKVHGFNYIRLRIFNNPAADSGYSPQKGFCDLQHTLAMAKRIKALGLKLLLNFHYSDYWADPGKQYTPEAWKNLSLKDLQDSVFNFTKRVMLALKAQGTLPDMVQVGNEINHGMMWQQGHVNNLDGMAALFIAGENAVLTVAPDTKIMLHLALGGQNEESVFLIENMLARGVQFDVIGLSYYPRWHGTLDELQNNLYDLLRRYDKDLVVVEYTFLKEKVNEIIFNLPNNKGKGSFIWEPLNTWEAIFDKDGKANKLLYEYDEIAKRFL